MHWSEFAVDRTPDGRRLSVSRTIDVDTETVWTVLTDTHRWPEWGPSIAAVECEERFIEAGSRGRVRTVGPGVLFGRRSGGLWIPFRVTDCDGRRWTWTVGGVPATGHRVESVRNGSRVVFEVPPVAAAYLPICRRALVRIERLAMDTAEP